ncbi:MAG: DUF4432 family protein [Phycisphaeraceae bacterium]|nr:DUF4432 family protein [Phycisphaeraceae bacterium]
MAKKSRKPVKQPTKGKTPPQGLNLDTEKFESIHQVGGIRTATFDYPNPSGSATAGCRVAMVDTGSGLRFVVALDRGGDIVEASYNRTSLAYLTPNDYKPPSYAYNEGLSWLNSWPGGLVTTCGPRYMGGAREEDGQEIGLHGTFSNTPAAVEMVVNPDPQQGKYEMLLSLIIRDARMFGPVVEVRRQIQCVLGRPEIRIFDQVTNRGNARVAHNWLYHCNLGYPLVDEDCKLIYRGPVTYVWPTELKPTSKELPALKTVRGPLESHRGSGEEGLLLDPRADRQGIAHVGLINRKRGLALELEYPIADLPRLANWQHYGPGGSYVVGVEPYFGSLLGKNREQHPWAEQWLKPGQSRRYQLTLRVLDDPAALAAFARHDGPIQWA